MYSETKDEDYSKLTQRLFQKGEDKIYSNKTYIS